MAEQQNRHLIPAEEFVEVVDKTTEKPLPHPIPKHWIGTDLAPNVKRATRRSSRDD